MAHKSSSSSSVPFTEPLWLSRGISAYHNESHRRLQRELRAYVNARILPFCQQWEQQGFVPPEVLAEHARRGYVAASVFPLANDYLQGQRLPGDVAKEEWDAFHMLIFSDEIARCGCLGVIWGLAGGASRGAVSIVNYGTEQQKKEYLPGAFSGKTTFCLGVNETGIAAAAGFDVAATATTAERRGGIYIVNGAKRRVINGISADYCTAAVRTGTGAGGQQGISLLIIPLNAPGVTRQKMEASGVRASGSASIEFKDVQVPVSNLIGQENRGFGLIVANDTHQRLVMASISLGLARCCLEDAYLWAAGSQKTLDRPPAYDQTARKTLSAAGKSIDAAYAWTEQLTYMGDKARRAGRGVHMAGLFANIMILATQTLDSVNREAQQILGGVGHDPRDGRAARVEQIGRDLKFLVMEGGGDDELTDLALAHEERAMTKL